MCVIVALSDVKNVQQVTIFLLEHMKKKILICNKCLDNFHKSNMIVTRIKSELYCGKSNCNREVKHCYNKPFPKYYCDFYRTWFSFPITDVCIIFVLQNPYFNIIFVLIILKKQKN
jgi:hypothetical protein